MEQSPRSTLAFARRLERAIRRGGYEHHVVLAVDWVEAEKHVRRLVGEAGRRGRVAIVTVEIRHREREQNDYCGGKDEAS